MRRIAAGLLLAATSASAVPPPRVYVIERIGERIAPDTVIGSRRAGLMCLPNGRLRWSEIGMGGPSDRREIVEDTLEDAGLPIATLSSGTPIHRQIRLRGIVTDGAAELCAKNYLGDRTRMSGTAKLSVEWRGEELGADAPPLHHVSTVERAFEGKDAASHGAIGRLLLEDATRDLARWLQAGAAE